MGDVVRTSLTQEVDEEITDLKGRARELLGKIKVINERLLPKDVKPQAGSQEEPILIKTEGWLKEKISQLNNLGKDLEQILEEVNRLYDEIDAGLAEKPKKEE